LLSKEYIPAIDGMRAIAIALVIASHFGAERFVPGGFGVTLFFFISGYLITGLLIQEDSASGKIGISSFYIRRFLRLGPALITMIAAVSVIYFLLFGTVDGKQIFASLFYYANFYAIFGGTAPMPLWPLWSLAVEEHYYLVYPLVFAVAWRYRERFLLGLVILTVAVLLWRIALVVHWKASDARVYLGTDTRIDSVLYGAMLAVMLKTRFAVFTRYLGHWAAVAAGAFLLLITFVYRDPTFRETFRYSLQGIALFPLFYAAVFVPRFLFARRVLESPAMIWIGRLSYSLYLYHLPVFVFVATLLPKLNVVLLTLISLPTIIATASFSYYCVEKPFQKLRNKFRGEHAEGYPAQEILIIQPKS
jgi:peptidoglycan/LPS O-acetylase OafA/YrhL